MWDGLQVGYVLSMTVKKALFTMRTLNVSSRIVLLDDEDFDRVSVFSWYWAKKNSGRGYAKSSSRKLGRNVPMHRFILNLVKGDGMCVDHIDGNTANNQKSNLRVCSQQENNRNRGKNPTSTLKYKGVVKTGKHYFGAAIKIGDRTIRSAAKYVSQEEAARVYDNLALQYFGKFARLNFPEVLK